VNYLDRNLTRRKNMLAAIYPGLSTVPDLLADLVLVEEGVTESKWP
jgi:hypothetical protein